MAQAMTGGSWDDLRANIERVIARALQLPTGEILSGKTVKNRK
jgi:hypothetical protein